MSGYAVSRGGREYRTINSESDLLPGEVYSATRPVDPPPTLEEIIAAIDAHAASLRNAAARGASAYEMAEWADKRAEALAYDGTPSSCPHLTAEAANRGCSVATLVEKVLAKSEAKRYLEGHIAGIEGMHKDAARLAADPAAYDWSGCWPVVAQAASPASLPKQPL